MGDYYNFVTMSVYVWCRLLSLVVRVNLSCSKTPREKIYELSFWGSLCFYANKGSSKPVSFDLQMPSAQNNFYATVLHSGPFQHPFGSVVLENPD